jgi:hypothetical protein
MICSFCPCQTCQSMGLGGSPMVAIKYIMFARYPPRSETSHDGGLVGLYEPQKLCVLLLIMLVIVMQVFSAHVVDICSLN